MIGRTGDIRVVTGRIVDEENRRSRASGELTYSLSLGTLIGDDGKPDTVGSQGVGAISALGMGYVRQDDNFHVPAQTLQRESGSGNHRYGSGVLDEKRAQKFTHDVVFNSFVGILINNITVQPERGPVEIGAVGVEIPFEFLKESKQHLIGIRDEKGPVLRDDNARKLGIEVIRVVFFVHVCRHEPTFEFCDYE